MHILVMVENADRQSILNVVSGKARRRHERDCEMGCVGFGVWHRYPQRGKGSNTLRGKKRSEEIDIRHADRNNDTQSGRG